MTCFLTQSLMINCQTYRAESAEWSKAYASTFFQSDLFFYIDGDAIFSGSYCAVCPWSGWHVYTGHVHVYKPLGCFSLGSFLNPKAVLCDDTGKLSWRMLVPSLPVDPLSGTRHLTWCKVQQNLWLKFSFQYVHQSWTTLVFEECCPAPFPIAYIGATFTCLD